MDPIVESGWALLSLGLLAEILARSLVLALIAAIAVTLFRLRNPRQEHAVWVGALVGMLLLPGLCASPFRLRLERPELPASWAFSGGASLDLPWEAATGEGDFSFASEGVLLPAPIPAQAARSRERSAWPAALVALYVLVSAGLLLRWLSAAWLTSKIARSGTPIRDLRWRLLSERVAGPAYNDRLMLRRSPAVSVPMTAGWRYPVILVPMSWREWSDERRRCVLQHEAMHVRRRDFLTRSLAILHRCVLWPNPLAWWLVRRLTVLADRACDEGVLAEGAGRRCYAQHLLEVAWELVRQPRLRLDALSMADPSRLDERIEAILSWQRRSASRRFGRWPGLALGVSLAAVGWAAMAVDMVEPTSGRDDIGLATVSSSPGLLLSNAPTPGSILEPSPTESPPAELAPRAALEKPSEISEMPPAGLSASHVSSAAPGLPGSVPGGEARDLAAARRNDEALPPLERSPGIELADDARSPRATEPRSTPAPWGSPEPWRSWVSPPTVPQASVVYSSASLAGAAPAGFVPAHAGVGPREVSEQAMREDVPEAPAGRKMVVFMHSDRYVGWGERSSSHRAAALARSWLEKDLRPTDRVAVVSYRHRLRVRAGWTADSKSLAQALEKPRREQPSPLAARLVDLGQGHTKRRDRSVFGALELLAEAISTMSGPKHVLFLSGGFDRTSPGYRSPGEEALEALAARLRRGGVIIHLIDLRSLGTHASPRALSGLERLAAASGGQYRWLGLPTTGPVNSWIHWLGSGGRQPT